jgi:thiol-disulfide isomerase/thioredoxin
MLALAFGAVAPGATAAEDPVETCTERLKAVHKALVAYERDHHQWPDHLSDLVPRYLPDAAALRDPADPGTGDLGSDQAKADPRSRVSYSYERCADVSNGLPGPLGPFPKPDIPGASWGSWRLVNGHQEAFFGDQVPLVRCFLHRPPAEDREPGKDLVLNLTPAGRVYRSDYAWEHHPDSAAYLLRTLDRDLTQGAGHVARRWILFRVNEYLGNQEALDAGRLGPVMRSVADRLLAIRDELPDGARHACFIAAVLRKRAGDLDGAQAALDACAAYPGAPWSPIVEAQERAEVLHAQKRYDREIEVYEWLLRERPGVVPYMEKLAAAFEAAGDRAKAAEWRRKADPGAALVGRPAPEFRVPLLAGGTATLAEARRGKKALLLNFWFRGCEPCRLEFPHLQELYERSAPAGLEVLAVDRGDPRAAVEGFVGGTYSFPIGLGRNADGADNTIFANYHVSAYPTSYLIDGEGRVVWRGVGFGPELKKGLAAALAELGL